MTIPPLTTAPAPAHRRDRRVPAAVTEPGKYRADRPEDSPPTTDAPARYRGRRRRTLLDVAVARVSDAVDAVTVDAAR